MLTIGKIIAGFRLEEQIHSGGMASIWRVTKPEIALPMVMKIPKLSEGYEPSFIVTFEAEQMILPRLNGPHVPSFVAIDEISDTPFLVMEYIIGPSLQTQMTTKLVPEEIARIGSLIASAIHDIHSQQVIHLDISPGNILFRHSGEAVLIDFGLSRHDQLPDLMNEEFRLPMGTAPYIAPEQVLNIRNDPRSDIFSLGVILYQLVTGEQPFGDPTSLAGLKRRLYIDPIPPRILNQECHAWLEEIILCCLEVDPNVRYSSAAHLAFALQHPEQVVITTHLERRPKKGILTSWRRWLFSAMEMPESAIKTSIPRHMSTVSIIMVAVDVTSPEDALAEALRQTISKMMNYEKKARLTCITIRKTPIIGIDFGVNDEGENLFLQYLVKLKHWARALNLAAERISFHVIEGVDPAWSLVHYATMNQVEHIVIGAKSHSTLRRILGSVSAHVVISASCTVTVVRVREDDRTLSGEHVGYASHG